jgi:hypothetical protein
MNDALRDAIRYRVTTYPRAPANQPRDARELVRCFWCDHWKERDAVCCDPVTMAQL